MTTFVAFLRGVNVGGRRRIKMGELTELLNALGYGSVVTYLQSGNCVFQAEERDSRRISRRISEMIRDRFELDVAVLVLTGEELLSIHRNNPLLQHPGSDAESFHATILAEPAASAEEKELEALRSPSEEFALGDRAIYLSCPEGYRKTKLTNSVIEKRCGVPATTRNWRTLSALAELVRA